MIKTNFTAAIISAIVVFSACSKTSVPHGGVSKQSNEVILQWDETAFNAFGGAQYQHSLMASRINAMMHLAMHDALNGIEEKYSRYAFSGKDAEADAIAAAASAAHTVLISEIPARKSFIDSALMQSLENVKEGEAKTR